METFVRSARNYVEYREQGSFSHKYDDLIDIAKSGKKPCSECERQKSARQLTVFRFTFGFGLTGEGFRKRRGF